MAFPIILSSPSGGGKTTIAQKLLTVRRDVGYSVSCTTRPPREGDAATSQFAFACVTIEGGVAEHGRPFGHREERELLGRHALAGPRRRRHPRHERTCHRGRGCVARRVRRLMGLTQWTFGRACRRRRDLRRFHARRRPTGRGARRCGGPGGCEAQGDGQEATRRHHLSRLPAETSPRELTATGCVTPRAACIECAWPRRRRRAR